MESEILKSLVAQAPGVVGVIVVAYLFLRTIENMIKAFMADIQNRDVLFLESTNKRDALLIETMNKVADRVEVNGRLIIEHAEETRAGIAEMHRRVSQKKKPAN